MSGDELPLDDKYSRIRCTTKKLESKNMFLLGEVILSRKGFIRIKNFNDKNPAKFFEDGIVKRSKKKVVKI